MSDITVDIGELCTHCFEDTSFGSGKKVNRIPSGSDAKIMLDTQTFDKEGNLIEIPITINGWMCFECRLIECDKCDKYALEVEHVNNGNTVLVLCEDCYEEMDKAVMEEDIDYVEKKEDENA